MNAILLTRIHVVTSQGDLTLQFRGALFLGTLLIFSDNLHPWPFTISCYSYFITEYCRMVTISYIHNMR